MSRNVVLFGAMASGKTGIADALSRAGYQRLSFSSPLKAVVELGYGKIEKGNDYDVTTDRGDRNLSGRELLQGIGEAVKAVDRAFWTKCFLRTAASFGDTPLVVDDGRFLMEFETLSSNGWLTVGVNAHQAVRMQRYESVYGRAPTEAEMSHQSELEVPDILFKCQIVLQGTDDSYENAQRILRVARA